MAYQDNGLIISRLHPIISLFTPAPICSQKPIQFFTGFQINLLYGRQISVFLHDFRPIPCFLIIQLRYARPESRCKIPWIAVAITAFRINPAPEFLQPVQYNPFPVQGCFHRFRRFPCPPQAGYIQFIHLPAPYTFSQQRRLPDAFLCQCIVLIIGVSVSDKYQFHWFVPFLIFQIV